MKKALLLAAALAALAPNTALAERPCLEFGYIYNWTALNDRTLIVEDYYHRKYKMSLIGVCYNLKFHERLAFKSPGALALTCLSPGDEVITRDFGTGFSRCAITHIDYYTPEMERADRAAADAAKEQRHGGY